MHTKRLVIVHVFKFWKGRVSLEYLYLFNRRQGGLQSHYILRRKKITCFCNGITFVSYFDKNLLTGSEVELVD